MMKHSLTLELTYEEMVAHVQDRIGKRMKLTSYMEYVRKNESEYPALAPVTGGIVEGASFDGNGFWILLDNSVKNGYPLGEPFGNVNPPKFIPTSGTFNLHVGGLVQGAKWEQFTDTDAMKVLYPDGSYFVLIFLEPDAPRTFLDYEGKVMEPKIAG